MPSAPTEPPTEPPRELTTIEAMNNRRSHPKLESPAPTPDQLAKLIDAAVTAPDHGRLTPWRFIELRPPAYADFGTVLADALAERCRAEGAEPNASQLEKERSKLHRAPLVVVAAAVRRPSTKIPWIEQFAAAAAATQNLLLAATSSGWGTMWRTGPAAYDPNVKSALSLNPDDAIVGFIYIGTAEKARERRERLDTQSVLDTWQAR